jgi:hypothetical protein
VGERIIPKTSPPDPRRLTNGLQKVGRRRHSLGGLGGGKAVEAGATSVRTERALVWVSHKDSHCSACQVPLGRGEFIAMDRARGIRCLKCAGLGGLVFLPSGDVAVTRRAVAASGRSAVVLKFSRARRRNERQGVLVEESAVEQAR